MERSLRVELTGRQRRCGRGDAVAIIRAARPETELPFPGVRADASRISREEPYAIAGFSVPEPDRRFTDGLDDPFVDVDGEGDGQRGRAASTTRSPTTHRTRPWACTRRPVPPGGRRGHCPRRCVPCRVENDRPGDLEGAATLPLAARAGLRVRNAAVVRRRFGEDWQDVRVAFEVRTGETLALTAAPEFDPAPESLIPR